MLAVVCYGFGFGREEGLVPAKLQKLKGLCCTDLFFPCPEKTKILIEF